MSERQTEMRLNAAILETRALYARRGISPEEIRNGLCFEFAGDVMERAFGSDWIFREGQEGWRTLASDEIYLPLPGREDTLGAAGWDWSLLENGLARGIAEADRARLDAIVARDPCHCWILMGDRHYDCDHPEGVANFFDLTFFRRWLDGPAAPGSMEDVS